LRDQCHIQPPIARLTLACNCQLSIPTLQQQVGREPNSLGLPLFIWRRTARSVALEVGEGMAELPSVGLVFGAVITV